MKSEKLSALQGVAIIISRLGIFFLISPPLIYLSIIIKGDVILKWPFPFSHLGSAPFQIVVYASLILIGLILICVSKFLKYKTRMALKLPVKPKKIN